MADHQSKSVDDSDSQAPIPKPLFRETGAMMDTDFWHQKWANNEIGFHKDQVNPLLTLHINHLSLQTGDRILLPLCGKTLDIAWLLSQGFEVIGIELSQLAIDQLFETLDITPQITQHGNVYHYQAPNINVFVGDIFEISKEQIGPVNAVYDRAALVALPLEMRLKYTSHLRYLSDDAQQLLITFEYNQSLLNGPPFSVTNEEVATHYQEHYLMSLLLSQDVPGGLKGKCAATEHVWFLEAHS